MFFRNVDKLVPHYMIHSHRNGNLKTDLVKEVNLSLSIIT
jgi:hypothetical protein